MCWPSNQNWIRFSLFIIKTNTQYETHTQTHWLNKSLFLFRTNGKNKFYANMWHILKRTDIMKKKWTIFVADALQIKTTSQRCNCYHWKSLQFAVLPIKLGNLTKLKFVRIFFLVQIKMFKTIGRKIVQQFQTVFNYDYCANLIYKNDNSFKIKIEYWKKSEFKSKLFFVFFFLNQKPQTSQTVVFPIFFIHFGPIFLVLFLYQFNRFHR